MQYWILRKINIVNPKHGGLVQMIFAFNWVLFRFPAFIFHGGLPVWSVSWYFTGPDFTVEFSENVS